MANTRSNKHQQGSQFLKQEGSWVTGKVDKNSPDIKKGIESAKQLQQQIIGQKDVSQESLKRLVKL